MFVFDQLKKSDPRLQVLSVGIFVGMAILVVGLWWVQIVSSRRHMESQVAQSFRTVRIPAIRGKIVDRFNQPLAENRPSHNVCLYLDELRTEFRGQYLNHVKPEYLAANPETTRIRGNLRYQLEREARYRAASNLVQRLSKTIGKSLTLEAKEFHRHYLATRALPMIVAEDLTDIEVARFLEQPSDSIGLDLEIQPTRSYPRGIMLGHTLGYLMKDTQSTEGEEAFVDYRLRDYSGKKTVGIERVFDGQLRGRGGVKSVLVNSVGYRQSENIWTPSEAGHTVKLTIDARIQASAEKHLEDVGEGTRGAVIVMDPTSGDIYAMASAPTFNPNSFIPRISNSDWRRLMDKEQRPMINRCIQENYPPGSIFKIVSGLAALEAGLDPLKKFYNPGYAQVGRRKWRDLARPGMYDFRLAFLKSSNTYFISNSLAIGPAPIAELGARFHLGRTNGIPSGQEVPGHFPSPERVKNGWYLGDTANMSIGQGPVDVTPLQIAVMVSAVANGGTVYKPRLVSEIRPQDESGEKEVQVFKGAQIRNRLNVKQKNLQIVRDAMLADVEDPQGTGKAAAVPGVTVCGKTGTAQVQDARGRAIDQITWFASYAPFESARFVVVVMIESGYSGGTTCAPVAQKIYTDLQSLNLLPKPPDPAMVSSR